jgi:hypothetical protein
MKRRNYHEVTKDTMVEDIFQIPAYAVLPGKPRIAFQLRRGLSPEHRVPAGQKKRTGSGRVIEGLNQCLTEQEKNNAK